MLDLIRELRERGIRTSLLSNSWGVRDGYPRHLFDQLFDDVVISGEVGMRKPEERIFQLALTRLGLSAAEDRRHGGQHHCGAGPGLPGRAPPRRGTDPLGAARAA